MQKQKLENPLLVIIIESDVLNEKKIYNKIVSIFSHVAHSERTKKRVLPIFSSYFLI